MGLPAIVTRFRAGASLLRAMLAPNPADRISIEDCLAKQVFQDSASTTQVASTEEAALAAVSVTLQASSAASAAAAAAAASPAPLPRSSGPSGCAASISSCSGSIARGSPGCSAKCRAPSAMAPVRAAEARCRRGEAGGGAEPQTCVNLFASLLFLPAAGPACALQTSNFTSSNFKGSSESNSKP